MKTALHLLLAGLFAFASTAATFGDDEQTHVIKKEIKVTVEDGKMVVDTGDGPREIALGEWTPEGGVAKILAKANAHADGDAEVKVNGQIIMIDDDGEKHVIELGDGNNNEFLFIADDKDKGHGHKKHGKRKKKGRHAAIFAPAPGSGLPGNIELMIDGDVDGKDLVNRFMWMQHGNQPNVFTFGNENVDYEFVANSKYMVGIEIMPISDLLRHHLNIDEEVGIAVGGVVEDSPAAAAGLQEHDIIVTADGNAISGYATLVEAVEAAGESGDAIEFQLIREGESTTAQVLPMKRNSGDDEDDDDGDEDDDDDEDDEESVEDLRGEIESLREALETLRGELEDRG